MGYTRASVLQIAARLLRSTGVDLLAGIVAGLVIGGLGSRLVMRIVAVTASDKTGMVTDAGNRVGDITINGTMELIAFAGLFSGVAGGLACLALARWRRSLPPAKGADGVILGLVLFAVFGSAVIEPNNHDFRAFGFPLLNVLLFAALFPLFGVVQVRAAIRLDSILTEAADAEIGNPSRSRRAWVRGRMFVVWFFMALSVALAFVFVGLGIVASVRAALGVGDDRLFPPGLLLLAMLALSLANQVLSAVVGARTDQAAGQSAQRNVAQVSTTVLVVLLLGGLALTVQALWTILQPGV
jgi:hypothetical protein